MERVYWLRSMFLLHCVVCIITAVVVELLTEVVLSRALPSQYATMSMMVFVLPLIVNGIAAWNVCRRISAEGARWVWIPWALFLLRVTVGDYPPAHTLGRYFQNTWNLVFTPDCAATECGFQFLLGTPLVGSVVYALTAVVARWDASEEGAAHGP